MHRSLLLLINSGSGCYHKARLLPMLIKVIWFIADHFTNSITGLLVAFSSFFSIKDKASSNEIKVRPSSKKRPIARSAIGVPLAPFIVNSF